MKCPVCQAKLLPVDGEMFCLQCGTAVEPQGGPEAPMALEETTDPLLQRAIVDAINRKVSFRTIPKPALVPAKPPAFSSLRAFLSPSRAVPPMLTMSPALAGSSGTVVGVKTGAASLNLLPEKAPASHAWSKRMPLAWLIGLGVFAVFVLGNGAILSYYQDRVYPGVRIGTMDVGGLAFADVAAKLTTTLPKSRLVVQLGAAEYALEAASVSASDVNKAVRAARVGHSTPLPLAGWLQGLMSAPIVVSSTPRPDLVAGLLAQLERATSRPSDAVLMVVKGQPVLIEGKTGLGFDVNKVKAAIDQAYGRSSRVTLETVKLEPSIRAAAYDSQLQAVQSRLALTLRLTRKASVYAPTSEQVGEWLVVQGPGKSLAVNGAGVADFVAQIPGAFDRVAATNALLAAVTQGQSLDYALVTSTATATPRLASVVPAGLPGAYTYCLDETAPATLPERLAVAVDNGAWGLGGKLRFAPAQSGCNLIVMVVPAAEMLKANPACAGQIACEAGNILMVDDVAWAAAPGEWNGSLATYRAELLTHEVGHWLGFDHTSCLGQAQPAPILTVPSVVLPGCSPNWYAVPAEMQGTKPLNHF